MSNLAEMALERARRRLGGKPAKGPASKAPKISTPPTDARPRSLEVVFTGPINHFMFLEGRSWAIDMVASLRAAPVAVVMERLTGATLGRPGSYAAGIQSVVKELQEAEQAALAVGPVADVTDRLANQNLTHQVE